jgi:hypothetical protein
MVSICRRVMLEKGNLPNWPLAARAAASIRDMVRPVAARLRCPS